MQKQEKTFLILFVVFAVLGILAFSGQFMLDNAHALTQYFIGGLSNGKLIIAIAWLSLMPLACLAALKLGIAKRLEKKEKLLLSLFAATAVLVFALGILQFYYFSAQFGNQGIFATMLAEGNYTNWEASKLAHNHFPKIGLYFLEKTLGINTGSSFDDGKPLYFIFPNAELWGALFAVLEILLVAFALLFLISKSNKISAFDFLLFSLASLSIAIHALDGGIATGTVVFGILLLIIFALRNYSGQEGRFKNILPLGSSLVLLASISALTSAELLSAAFTIPLLLTIGLGYYLIKELQENRLKKSPALNLALIIVFIFALNSAVIMLDVFAEGKWVADFSGKTGFAGDGLFIYGIPDSAKTSDLKAELEKFGSIEEFDRKGWTAYARIIPNPAFRTLRLEKKLEEKFSPKGYFYVEEAIPMPNSGTYTLYLPKGQQKPAEFDKSFLGLKVLKQDYNPEKNALVLSIEGKYDPTWQMLAVLQEARQKGIEKQALLAK